MNALAENKGLAFVDESGMAWPTPQYSKTQVNKAGEILGLTDSSDSDREWAQEVLGNWRACHGYPINTFKVTLREKVNRIDVGAIVAQRLKRTPSIISKLRRFPTMQLARMQDIGGLRAVVGTFDDVKDLQAAYKKCQFKHELVSEKDYILRPKADGYRSVHLVFKYVNDKAPRYNGLAIELQLRTKLQHAWATAVETMGTFLGQALKASQGDKNWLRFFEVTASAFAYMENAPLVPGYEKFSKRDIFLEVIREEESLGVIEKLHAYSIAVDVITERGAGAYHLVILDSSRKKVTVRPYPLAQLDIAMQEYTAQEERARRGELIEAVLVSAGSISSLKRAFPNYFLDTNDFVHRVAYIQRSINQGAVRV